jgi:hypothetical protein
MSIETGSGVLYRRNRMKSRNFFETSRRINYKRLMSGEFVMVKDVWLSKRNSDLSLSNRRSFPNHLIDQSNLPHVTGQPSSSTSGDSTSTITSRYSKPPSHPPPPLPINNLPYRTLRLSFQVIILFPCTSSPTSFRTSRALDLCRDVSRPFIICYDCRRHIASVLLLQTLT